MKHLIFVTYRLTTILPGESVDGVKGVKMSITKEVTASAMFPQALLGGNGLPTLDLLSNFMCDIDQQLTQQEKK